MVKFFKKHPYFFWLLVIFLISIFFRTYEVIERLNFAHDSDLASWIVKDIVVNHHYRLIGQLTTAEGIFIGPLFYYLLIPFYLITKMDPVGSIILITLLGILTTLSYYYVFAKLFNQKVGLIAAFLQATLISSVTFDRWIVPSSPTNLWSIWLFYVVIMLVRGRQFVLVILGALVGLIWHIHIALAPALLSVIPAFVLNFKFPKIKYIAGFLIAFFIGSIPLIFFETRHNFSQTLALISNFTTNHGGGSGLGKLNLLTIKMGSSADALFFSPQSFFLDEKRILLAIILLSTILLPKCKLIKWKELIVLLAWIFGVIIFFTLSSSPVSEYYFASTNVILIFFVSLWFSFLYEKRKWGKYLVLILLSIILIKNLFFFMTVNVYNQGYVEKKMAVEYIIKDSKKKNYPCVAISYITRPGDNVGFRYFFWLNNLHVNEPKSGSPVYTLVIPEEMAEGVNNVIFGHIGVIVPEKTYTQAEINRTCSGGNSNLTDPMLLYTE
ncbi:MAG: hypothetical protein Q7R97_02680 [Candidatus Daviesbacteria bacterium]|nr:hypothetical protein [Candidatus Daviesbacteria bacterium]